MAECRLLLCCNSLLRIQAVLMPGAGMESRLAAAPGKTVESFQRHAIHGMPFPSSVVRHMVVLWLAF